MHAPLPHTGPTSTKEGTDTTAPVSRVAFLVPAPEAVLPFTPGGVSVICVNKWGERDGTEFSSDAAPMICLLLQCVAACQGRWGEKGGMESSSDATPMICLLPPCNAA